MPHEPTEACKSDHCYIHDEDEPIPPEGAYLVCGECFHAYPTPTDLEAAWVVGGQPARPAAEILFCPHCAHDF